MKLSVEQMQQLIDYLQGTCMSVDEALMRLFDVDQCDIDNEMEMCEYLDQRIFLCVQCGWWYESGDWTDYDNVPEIERGNGEYCTSCGQENGWTDNEF